MHLTELNKAGSKVYVAPLSIFLLVIVVSIIQSAITSI